MGKRRNPYTALPAYAYWKTAVAETQPDEIGPLWKAKFAIDRSTAIATAGSCFAQHIGSALTSAGFNWVDSEPCPAELAPEHRPTHGYGLFSFRTGNIYTARLLRQWIEWALGEATMPGEVFVEEGRFFDPYRPAIPKDGYGTLEELQAARQATLDAIGRSLTTIELLVFTLGLTESWINSAGVAYPMCPGTVRGEFLEDRHQFHNFTGQDVLADLSRALDMLRGVNPRLRLLLTVSPVPLVATASGKHVMTATTYSKSVLRSVAGELADLRQDVDYFPSYEIIVSPAFKGRFFEPNLRSVTSDGVHFVMDHFFSCIGAADWPERGGAPASAQPTKVPQPRASSSEICEEIVLETWSNRHANDSSIPPNILLLGDSQMGMAAKALEAQGIRYAGGAIMQASEWHYQRFALTRDPRVFEPAPPEAAKRWNETWESCLSQPSAASDVTVITNVGTHTCVAMIDQDFDQYLRMFYPVTETMTIPKALIRSYFLNTRLPHLMLLRKFVDAGFKVIWITDPPTQERFHQLYAVFDEVLEGLFANTGCEIFNARNWLAAMGTFPPEFLSTEIDPITQRPDWVHGSPEYYRELLGQVFRLHSVRPLYREDAAVASS